MSNIKLNDYLNKQLQNQKFQKEFEQETIQLERSFAHDVSEKHCPVASSGKPQRIMQNRIFILLVLNVKSI